MDIDTLIEVSRPRNTFRRLGLLVPIAWVCLFVTMATQRSGPQEFAVGVLAIGVTLGVTAVLRSAARSAAAEQVAISQMEDQLALKHVPNVLAGIAGMLSRPMRTAESRLRGLVLLATALARSDRPEEALRLYDQLLENERVAGDGATVLRAARAMALLRTDRLFDADTAITDLRRRLRRPATPKPVPTPEEMLEAEPETVDFDEITDPIDRDAPHLYAAVRLVELYRYVKTGHAEDAITVFTTDRTALRTGLSHRYAEALALVAAAYDRLGQTAEAAQAFGDATALAPAVELVKRYPELQPVSEKYAVTTPPRR